MEVPICLHRHSSPCGMFAQTFIPLRDVTSLPTYKCRLYLCGVGAPSSASGLGSLCAFHVSVSVGCGRSHPILHCRHLAQLVSSPAEVWDLIQKFCFKSCPCISYYCISSDCSHSLTYYMGRHCSRSVIDAGTEAQKK